MNLRATVTGKTYKVRGKLCCPSSDVIYLISCKLCKEQYVGSVFKDNFKLRLRVHKSDVITGKDRYGVVKHFLTKYTNGNKVKTLTFDSLNNCKRVIMILEVGCGVEKSIGRPNSLLYLMEWIVHGTGIVPIEKTTKKRNSYSFYSFYLSIYLSTYKFIWCMSIEMCVPMQQQ